MSTTFGKLRHGSGGKGAARPYKGSPTISTPMRQSNNASNIFGNRSGRALATGSNPLNKKPVPHASAPKPATKIGGLNAVPKPNPVKYRGARFVKGEF